MRALLRTAPHFCQVLALKLNAKRQEVARGGKHLSGGGDAAISLEGDGATDMHEYDRQVSARCIS